MPLAEREDLGEARFVGIEDARAADVASTLSSAEKAGFDFIVVPVRRPDRAADMQPATAATTDLALPSSKWASQVVGLLPEWIEPDSHDERTVRESERALLSECSWAGHLGLHAVLLPPPSTPPFVNYSRCLLSASSAAGSCQAWLKLPLHAGDDGTKSVRAFLLPVVDAGDDDGDVHDPWDKWDMIRKHCDDKGNHGIVLEIRSTESIDEAALERWFGEPVQAIMLNCTAFLKNKRGYPILPKWTQSFLKRMIHLHAQIILSGHSLKGDSKEPQIMASEDQGTWIGPRSLLQYWHYLSHFFQLLPELSQEERVEVPYRDYLQSPLQPLMDNLESQTYETFERDDAKYDAYEQALFNAMRDAWEGWCKTEGNIVVMVVGAGRGPLVMAALRAAENLGLDSVILVYALEKNPNAVLTLEALHGSESWGDKVQVFEGDMRDWHYPEKADIIVSELLGSFGDNELSPECLDGAQRALKEGGVMIPAEYTSYVAPLASTRLHNTAKSFSDVAHMETPYVVKLHRHALLEAPKPVWSFSHPKPAGSEEGNCRHGVARFHPRGISRICHGFAGFFDAKLYGSVHCSIHPATHTPEMFSWFPVYFPLRQAECCRCAFR